MLFEVNISDRLPQFYHVLHHFIYVRADNTHKQIDELPHLLQCIAAHQSVYVYNLQLHFIFTGNNLYILEEKYSFCWGLAFQALSLSIHWPIDPTPLCSGCLTTHGSHVKWYFITIKMNIHTVFHLFVFVCKPIQQICISKSSSACKKKGYYLECSKVSIEPSSILHSNLNISNRNISF